MPRAVITGCNKGDTGDPASLKNSYSLMTALVSREDARGDTLSMTPLEVIAFDDKTGLFNFYVFEATATGKPGTVTRFWRNKDGKVMQRRLASGSKTPADAKPHTHDACFRCHVNGAPLMNELAEPWTNWISPKKRLPTVAMSGTTKELVDSASLADMLEGIIRAGTDQYVGGSRAKAGWLNRTRDGLLPGGIAKIVEPLFCETELNYVSSDTRLGLPPQVFFDPAVTANASLAFPNPPAGPRPIPFLFPIRAHHNEAAERALEKRDYVTDGMIAAIRLIDDENDIFSAKRCGVFTDVKRELAKAEGGEADKRLEPRDVKELLKRVIKAAMPTLGLQPARLEYMNARLAGTVADKKQAAYNTELAQRLETMDKSPAAIRARDVARKKAAEGLFPNPANPRPVFPTD